MSNARNIADLGDLIVSANSSTTAFEIRQLGSGDAFRVEDSSNPDSSPFVINSSGWVGINNSSPETALHIKSDNISGAVSGAAALISGQQNNERLIIRSAGNPGVGTSVVGLFGARGTMDSPTAVLSGDWLGYYQLGGYDGSSWIRSSWITGFAEENWTTSARGSNIVFSTTPRGSTTMTERIRIDASGSMHIGQILENATIAATAANGTMAYDVITNRAVLYYTTNASANWTWNFRGSSTITLNSIMNIGQTLTIATLVTNGATAYFQNSQCQIDGTTSGVTQRWQGGTAPTSGNASSIDIYSHTIIKTANATFTVLSSQTRFA